MFLGSSDDIIHVVSEANVKQTFGMECHFTIHVLLLKVGGDYIFFSLSFMLVCCWKLFSSLNFTVMGQT